MTIDTTMGGDRKDCPPTHLSVIEATRAVDVAVRRQAFDTLVTSYWKPVYKYIRIKWRLSNEDAKDLTQGFFARAFEKKFFDTYDPKKAKFRTFLRTCLDRFVANEQKAAARVKRGGAFQFVALDFEAAEEELTLQTAEYDTDEYLNREWIRSLFGAAVENLRTEYEGAGKKVNLQVFERYDLGDADPNVRPTYRQVADELGISASQVTNYLAAARRRLRELVMERLREISASEEELRADAREFLGLDLQ